MDPWVIILGDIEIALAMSQTATDKRRKEIAADLVSKIKAQIAKVA